MYCFTSIKLGIKDGIKLGWDDGIMLGIMLGMELGSKDAIHFGMSYVMMLAQIASFSM